MSLCSLENCKNGLISYWRTSNNSKFTNSHMHTRKQVSERTSRQSLPTLLTHNLFSSSQPQAWKIWQGRWNSLTSVSDGVSCHEIIDGDVICGSRRVTSVEGQTVSVFRSNSNFELSVPKSKRRELVHENWRLKTWCSCSPSIKRFIIVDRQSSNRETNWHSRSQVQVIGVAGRPEEQATILLSLIGPSSKIW